jgi:hypothetical protein
MTRIWDAIRCSGGDEEVSTTKYTKIHNGNPFLKTNLCLIRRNSFSKSTWLDSN